MVLQVEQQAEYPLITVTVQHHIGRSLTFAQPPIPQRFTNAADALRLAKHFLESFS